MKPRGFVTGTTRAIGDVNASYTRIRAEETTLYAVVRDNLATLHGAVEDGVLSISLPAFVRKELSGYLACGMLCRGFAWLRCDGCKETRIVALTACFRTLHLDFWAAMAHAIIVGLGAKNAEFYGLARLDIAPPALQNSSEIVLQQAVKLQRLGLLSFMPRPQDGANRGPLGGGRAASGGATALGADVPVRVAQAARLRRRAAFGTDRHVHKTVLACYQKKSGGAAAGGKSSAVVSAQQSSSDLKLNPRLHAVFLDDAYLQDTAPSAPATETALDAAPRFLGLVHLQTREAVVAYDRRHRGGESRFASGTGTRAKNERFHGFALRVQPHTREA
jgi:hypothetical protein